jgi:arylsulfatase A-like enzyme
VIKTGYRKVGDAILGGTLLGAAGWSAYAATEVVFASLLFGFTRPFAVFRPWHWQLTGLLLGGYLVVGAVAGALSGLAVFLVRKAGWIRDDAPAVLEAAAALTLVGTVLWYVAANALSLTGGIPVFIAGLCYVVFLLVEVRSGVWSGRLGMLTNPWVIAGVLLGVEQTADLADMASAQQLGGNVALAMHLLETALVVLVASAVWFGRRLRPNLGAARWAGATLALAVVLIGSMVAIGMSHAEPIAVSAQTTAPASNASQTAGARPNVLVIVMDTVRADHLSLYGYQRDTSPNLKALAQDAMVYTHAQSATDITLTSHASLFTGMYPSWHGAYCQVPEAAYGRPLSKNVPTLAEILRGQGYTTMGVAANLYLRSAFGLDRGFQEFRIERPVPMLTDENRCQLRRPMRRLLNLVTDTAQFDRLNNSAEDINDEFFSTLDGRVKLGAGPQAPFFGFINYMDAHFPYIPPAPWDRKFPGKASTLTKDYLEAEQFAIAKGGDIPADYAPYCISQYDGGIAFLDAQIGRVIAGLKLRGLYDNTMIVVTSDHGEAFGERHSVEHGNSPYQNLLHVALMVKYPKSAHKGRVDTPVGLIDVAPTVLQQSGVAVPPAMQGHSLLDAARPDAIFAETFQCQVIQTVDCPGCGARAIVAWPLKYIAFLKGRRQLFRLDVDPDETRDVSSTESGDLSALSQTITAWGKTIPKQSVQQMKLDPEEIKRLKSLGYLGGGAK